MIPTRNNDHNHVIIDMCTVAQVNDREVTQDSWLQLWLSVAWIVWAWACDLVQQVIHWSRRHTGALWWLVPTRISLFLMPFLVTWRPHEALRGSHQQPSHPQRPASRAPRSRHSRILMRPSRRATTQLPHNPGATVGDTESGAVES